MIKQVIPHLGAWSVLINNESSNLREQLRMGIALIFK
jgi:hypothetical protein